MKKILYSAMKGGITMKRALYSAIVLLMLAGCIAGLTACGNNPAASGGTVKRYFWDTPSEQDLAAIDKFEKDYDAKVTYDQIAFDQYNIRILTDIAAGDSPDIIFLFAQNFPRVAVQKIVLPLDELDQKLINDSALVQTTEAARLNYKYAGKSYAAGIVTNEPVWIFFNKTMFQNLGVKTPREYFNEGTWNWDAFKKCAQLTTADTDKDEKTDRWGFATWRYDMWGIANGGSYVNYSDDGNIKLTFEDPKIMNALKFYQEGYFLDKYTCPDGNMADKKKELFTTGKLAMTADGMYIVKQYIGTMADEWDFVPVPLGPDNTSGLIPATIDGWGISATSDNVKGTLLYLKTAAQMMLDNMDKPDESTKYFNDEQWKTYKDYKYGEKSKLLTVSKYQGIGNMETVQNVWWDDIRAGTDLTIANAKHLAEFQAEVDSTLRDTKMPNVVKFNGAPDIDFEDGTMDKILFTAPKDGIETGWGSKEQTITSEAGVAFTGKSLKVTFDKDTNGDQLVLRTKPDIWNIPSYGHNYTISFDYRFLSDMDESEGKLYMYLCPESQIALETKTAIFGWKEMQGRLAGDNGSFKSTFDVMKEADKLCLVIGGTKNGDVVIDNIKIIENK